MADLLDIAPSTACDVVRVDGLRIVVRGISVDAIAAIVARFPQLRSIASSGGDDIVANLIAGCGVAIGPIIAAGCGHLGDERYEQRAARLLPEQQIQFLKAILWLTFPNGIGSFLEALTGLMGQDEGAKPVKMRLRKSPSASPLSSDAASHQTMQ